jgi:hypothetical protein
MSLLPSKLDFWQSTSWIAKSTISIVCDLNQCCTRWWKR